ncbi:DUF2584 domain-containing protein [Patescibacteria group bacterium]|nr:DUF2584 domain-containing protein [Patescibacteria group bacterium]
MGYLLEINSLLRIPSNSIDLSKIKVGDKFTIKKDGERLYPLNIPIEICDENYVYYGKVVVKKLTLGDQKTILEIEVIKVFSKKEAQIFSKNFIKLPKRTN